MLTATVADSETWIGLIKYVGLPVAILAIILAAVFYAGWKVGKWVGPNILIPLRDRGLKFLDELSTTLEEIKPVVQQTHATVIEQRNMIKSLNDSGQEKLDELTATINKLHAATENICHAAAGEDEKKSGSG